MSEEKKQYDDDMRFVLFPEKERKNDKAPSMTGIGKIAGIELRFALWPKQVSKEGREFWSGRVEYKQGATRFLVPISPANVVATNATATAAASGDADPGDMPF